MVVTSIGIASPVGGLFDHTSTGSATGLAEPVADSEERFEVMLWAMRPILG
jgi:hypothetical protein